MNIDEMPAGPAIDLLIVERVMGATRLPYDGEGSIWHIPTKPLGVYFTISSHDDEDNWSPSTNIANAMEVWEKLSARFDISLEQERNSRVGRFVVFLHSGVDGWIDPTAVADTAPLAICRAALKAAGVK